MSASSVILSPPAAGSTAILTPVAGRLRAGHLVADERLDAALVERACELFGDLRILVRHEARQELDDRDLDAERAIERRELDADRAGAEHDERLRLRGQGHRLAVLDDPLAVDRDAGQRARARTGREDHVLGLERALPSSRVTSIWCGFHAPGARQQLRGARDRVDLVLLEQEADALGDLVGDIARALDHRGEVDADVVDEDAELFRALRVLEHLGGLQQRLGRDAAPVEADAAEALALDARGAAGRVARSGSPRRSHRDPSR